ncbi:magnesium transporter [Scheffersomyces coipomensis]|uniref:magnesium transporter n=1 Tax=Scheffersomyces coipomensis TaxID=1788519 RepID=UPI00315DF2C3
MATSSSTLVLYFVGILLLIHSGYSSYEFHKLSSLSHHSQDLPQDILLETLIGIVVIVIGGISSIENPNALSLNGELIIPEHKYLKPIQMKDSVKLNEKIGISDYEDLNSRLPFINIVKKRKEYDDFIKSSEQ